MEIIRIDLNGVNCYLGKQDGKFILFDTGGHLILDKQFDSRYDTLLDWLKTYGCTPENLKLIVLTHGDNDHAANAFMLRKQFGAKIAIHENDRALVENPDIDTMMKSFKYRSILFKLVFLAMNKQIKKVMTKTLEEYNSCGKFTPDIYLSDGDSLSEYGFDAQVIHLPGHTAGSIGIRTGGHDFIAGDTFANIRKPETAPNAVNFKQLSDSVRKIKTEQINKIYPGHGIPFNFSAFRK